MGAWGGPKKYRIRGVIIAIALSSIGYLIASLQSNIYFVASGQFVILFFIATHWEDTKKGFLISLAGVVIQTVGFGLTAAFGAAAA